MHQTPPPRGRRSLPLVAGLVIAAVLLGERAAAASAAIPAARDRWVEVRSPSFVVLANTNERKAREVAASFERFRRALQHLRPDASHQHPVPLRIVVFDSDRSYEPYKLYTGDRSGALVGQFQHAAWADYILLNGNPRQGDALPVVYHEYVHAFLRTNFTGVPLWLEEGLAEVYSTFTTDGSTLLVGRPHADHVRLLRERSFLPLAELFAADARSPAYREGERAGIFYAQSWLLAHYVMIGGGERVDQLRAFLDALRGGEPAALAFDAAFGRTMDELARELRAYVNSPTFPYLRLELAALGAEPALEVRPVPVAEALYELGTALALRGPETADAARAHLEAAAAAGVVDAWASLGLLEERRGRPAAAAELYGRAASAGAGRALSLVLQAQAMLAEGATPEAARTARALARRALALEPSYVEAEALVGRSYLIGDEPPAEGIAALDAALARLPGRPDVAYALAMLRLRAGDVTAAEHLIRAVVVPLGSADMAGHARQALERAQVKAMVDPAIASGDLDHAEEALRNALNGVSDPELRADLEGRLAQIADHRASAARFDRFNAAVSRANAGDLATAEEELRALRREVSEPPLQQAIDDALAKLAAARGR
jgi:hypothetical protein